MKRYFSPQERPSQRGAATLMIVLIAVIVATMAVAALAIAPQLKRITEERQTVKRANTIVEAVRAYYMARHELPAPGSVPVTALGLSQEYKFDTWGQEWCYYRAAGIAGLEIVTDGAINGHSVAGVLLSKGPNQTFASRLNDAASAMTGCPPDDGSTTKLTVLGDDIVFPLNVQSEAIQIAHDELKRLARAQCAFRIAVDYWETNIANLVNWAGLREMYAYDPWGVLYQWEDSDPYYFFTDSAPSGRISSPRLTVSMCSGDSDSVEGFEGFAEPVGELSPGGSAKGGTGILVSGDKQTLELGVDDDGAASEDTNGCIWYAGCEGTGNCAFGGGLRTYFKVEFSNSLEGFTFAVASGEHNTTDSCGGYISGSSVWGSLLAYAGPGKVASGTGWSTVTAGIKPPKLAIELDGQTNTGSYLCTENGRNDPANQHISLLYWGTSSGSDVCFTGNNRRYHHIMDDNTHGRGGSSGDPRNPDTHLTGLYAGSSLLSNKTLHVRTEIHRATIAGSNKGRYILKVWFTEAPPSDEFKDTSASHDATPDIAQTITLNSDWHEDFSRIIFGFTQATGGTTQNIAISDFKLHFIPEGGTISTLNDTGIDWCADGNTNDLGCPVTTHRGQDGDYGRDALARSGDLIKAGAGAAGFDFTKLDADGNDLPATESAWSCVRDNHTGLIWEVKTNDGGLRDRNHTYSWYNSDGTTNGGFDGTANGGSCVDGTNCDTEKFVAEVNNAGLCGANDWRLPTMQELLSIVHNGLVNPAMDQAYFPNAPSAWFWSSSPFASTTFNAWRVDFNYGSVNNQNKSNNNRVRLVRAGQ